MGILVQFYDRSKGAPSSWDWDFGDNSEHSTAQNPVHDYALEGYYEVTLTSYDGNVRDVVTETIAVFPPAPRASFSWSVDSTNHKAIRFQDFSASYVSSWDWTFGDGYYSTVQNPVHIYPAYSATYPVTLVARNSGGSSSYSASVTTGSETVVVPSANFSWSVSGGNRKQVNFTDLSLNTPTSWNWNWGDGSTNGITQNPFHIYDNFDTTYAVTLTATNSAGSDATSENVVTGHSVVPQIDFSWESVNDPSYIKNQTHYIASKQPILFEDISTDTYVSREWNFGFNYGFVSNTITRNTDTNGIYVAGASSLVTSPNSVDWFRGSLPINLDWYCAGAYHDNMYVLVSETDIYSSPDYTNWTLRYTATGIRFYDVIWGKNEFFAVGSYWDNNARAYARSHNGIDWTSTYSLTPSTDLYSVYWDGTSYITGGGWYHGNIQTSSDGSTWATPFSNNTYNSLWQMAQGNGKYVFIANSNTGSTIVSTDKITWTPYNTINVSGYVSDMIYAQGAFLGVVSGGSSSSSRKFLKSPDGITWGLQDSTGLLPNQVNGLVHGLTGAPDKQYVGVGRTSSAQGFISTSPDSTTWTTQFLSPNIEFESIACSDTIYVAVGYDGGPNGATVYSSPDGTTWTNRSAGITQTGYGFMDVVYAQGTFVAVSEKIYTSPNGIAWTLQQDYSAKPWNYKPLYSVTYGNDRFMVVGRQHLVAVSMDSTVWTEMDNAFLGNDAYFNVNYVGGYFYIASPSYTSRWRSIDGSSWTFLGYSGESYGIVEGPGILASFGGSGLGPSVYTSSSMDGTYWAWQGYQYTFMINASCIAFGNGVFVIGSYSKPQEPMELLDLSSEVVTDNYRTVDPFDLNVLNDIRA